MSLVILFGEARRHYSSTFSSWNETDPLQPSQLMMCKYRMRTYHGSPPMRDAIAANSSIFPMLKNVMILVMTATGWTVDPRHTVDVSEIQLTSWYGRYSSIYRVSYMSGGCLGFLNHQPYQTVQLFRTTFIAVLSTFFVSQIVFTHFPTASKIASHHSPDSSTTPFFEGEGICDNDVSLSSSFQRDSWLKRPQPSYVWVQRNMGNTTHNYIRPRCKTGDDEKWCLLSITQMRIPPAPKIWSRLLMLQFKWNPCLQWGKQEAGFFSKNRSMIFFQEKLLVVILFLLKKKTLQLFKLVKFYPRGN